MRNKSEFFSDNPGEVILTPGNFEAEGGLKFRTEKDRSYAGPYPAEFRLAAGDLIVVMTDLTQEARILGAAAFVPDTITCLHNQRLGKIANLDAGRLDRRFAYYVFNSRGFREAVKATASGSTVKHTAPGRICAYSFKLPPLPIQRRIASILGAYDDLIEVNRRRIAVLEEMARRLFDEWFVHFRFPGHEGHQMTSTSNGLLPEDWRVLALDAVAHLKMGQSPPSETYNETGVGLPFHQGVSDFGRHFPKDRVFTTSVDTDRVAEAGDVLFSVRAPVGRINVTLSKIVLGRGVSGIRGKETPFFVLEALRQGFQETDKMGNGTIFKSVTRRDVSSIPIVWHPAVLRQRFDAIGESIWGQLRVQTLANARLAASRDLLLPRLISGELPVSAAEAELESAA